MNYRKYYYKVAYDGETWHITPLNFIPDPMYTVVEENDAFTTNVFAWNGLCPALMEGRRLIEIHIKEDKEKKENV